MNIFFKNILYSPSKISYLSNEITNNQKNLYNYFISNEISTYIDNTKVKNNFSYNNLLSQNFINKIIFVQIKNSINIAQPLYQNYENIDDYDENIAIQKGESEFKYLEGDDDNNDNINKGKKIFKIEFFDGVQNFYGFEYQPFSLTTQNLLININKNENKYLKGIIGPNFEIIRGVFLLNNKNFKILI